MSMPYPKLHQPSVAQSSVPLRPCCRQPGQSNACCERQRHQLPHNFSQMFAEANLIFTGFCDCQVMLTFLRDNEDSRLINVRITRSSFGICGASYLDDCASVEIIGTKDPQWNAVLGSQLLLLCPSQQQRTPPPASRGRSLCGFRLPAFTATRLFFVIRLSCCPTLQRTPRSRWTLKSALRALQLGFQPCSFRCAIVCWIGFQCQPAFQLWMYGILLWLNP